VLHPSRDGLRDDVLQARHKLKFSANHGESDSLSAHCLDVTPLPSLRNPFYFCGSKAIETRFDD
jgi:hypothetical protein